jgi:hypothetical protein
MDISGNTLLPQTALIYPPFADTSYNQYKNVLLIDNTTPSYQTFVDSANNSTFPIVYSRDCSGTELLEVLRNRFTKIPRIGLIFTSNSNNSVTFLDNKPFFLNDEPEPYSTNVELIISIIREFTIQNVDFLACDTLNYSNWLKYYDFLKQSTGVIVGASDDKTGNLKYGGDWLLESTSQDIETVYFTRSIEYYQYLLDATDDTRFSDILHNKPPWGIYTAEKWNSSTNKLIEYRNNGKDATTSGVTRGTSVSGNGATGSITYLQGTTSSTIIWPTGSIPTNFTVCSIARYTGANQRRIFDGSGINWLHGSYYGNYNVAYYAKWISESIAPPTPTNWAVVCGKNDSIFPNNFIVNGVPKGTSNGGSGLSSAMLTINAGDYRHNESSDFQFSHLIIWDQVLTDTEMLYVSNRLMRQLSGESPTLVYDTLKIFYPPSPNFSIDAGNTKTVASGNLQVRITDLSNTSLNDVYYQYALNYNVNASFANTFVKANVSPYTFFIPSITDISNTIYVRASNPLGNSSPAANLQVTVYQTPRAPPQVSFTLVNSGNVRVSINESATTPVPYYYLNNVSYYLYAYNRFGGTNLSGNTSLSVYNIPVGILANTNTSYGNIVSYVNTGLTANTYTMYVIARNTVGNSNPISANIAVYTTPVSPTIDISNTQSLTSGTLSVFIRDASNSPTNGIYYLYSMDGITYGNSGVANTTYSFTINNTGNAQIPLVANTYTLRIAASNPIGNTIANPATASVIVYTTPSNISFDRGNTSIVTPGNLKVTINDASNGYNGVYYYYSIDGGATYANSNVPNNNSTQKTYSFNILYSPTAIKTICVKAQNPLGNSNVVGLNLYSPYNTSLYINSNLTCISGITNYAFPITGLSNQTYDVYLRGKNVMSYSGNSVPYNVTVYVTPSPNVSIDAGNTKTVASGNLQVRITDLSNTSLNDVYYQYALNYNVDASFANTFVKANVSPYTFFIPSITDISNTIYVRASNPVGNSFPAANLQVIVYQIPRTPSQVLFTLVNSGNVQVSINESATTPASYYYLNNVSYYLYAYNNFGGTNLSGNTSTLVYNIPVGVLANTNTSYGNIVSYVNTGLTANTYTMYVIARNTVGNSGPVSANIAVYTTPVSPIIDVSNTQSLTSGTLTVFIRDSSNSPTNGIYYLYSMDGITYGNSGVAKTTNTTYSFTINNTGNAQIPLVANTYTLRIAASNPLANTISSPATATEIVYTTPVSPTIDISNTQSLTSGTLTVSIIDSSNSPINGIYYLYSMDGITYGNSGVVKTGNTTYSFTINNTGNAQIPLIAKTYTLYIAAANPVGNSIASSVTATKSVYITPSPPTIDQGNTKSITSGNLNVGFTDTTNVANNQVEYTYFLYDSTGPSLFYV